MTIEEKIAALESEIAKQKAKLAGKPAFGAIYAEAHAAGIAAANAKVPTPMIVSEHANPLDDNSPVKKSWFVSQGVCGFAWVVVRPGNSPFANWLKKNHGASKCYTGGVYAGRSPFGQCYEKNVAYCQAFADVLTKHGFKAYAYDRLD